MQLYNALGQWSCLQEIILNIQIRNTFFVVVNKFSKNIKKVRIILYNNTFKSYFPHLAHFHYRLSAIGTRGRWSRGANFYCSIISLVFGEGKESSIIKKIICNIIIDSIINHLLKLD